MKRKRHQQVNSYAHAAGLDCIAVAVGSLKPPSTATARADGEALLHDNAPEADGAVEAVTRASTVAKIATSATTDPSRRLKGHLYADGKLIGRVTAFYIGRPVEPSNSDIVHHAQKVGLTVPDNAPLIADYKLSPRANKRDWEQRNRKQRR